MRSMRGLEDLRIIGYKIPSIVVINKPIIIIIDSIPMDLIIIYPYIGIKVGMISLNSESTTATVTLGLVEAIFQASGAKISSLSNPFP